MPPKLTQDEKQTDYIPIFDVVQRIKAIQKAFNREATKQMDKKQNDKSFTQHTAWK